MRANADARVRNDEIGSAEAAEEVARRALDLLRIRYINGVGDDGAGEREGDRPPGDQAEGGVWRGVVPRQRLSDAGGGAGDNNVRYLAFRTWSTR
jgi:hypothetical protein